MECYSVPSSAPALRAALGFHKKAIEAIQAALAIVEHFDPNAPDPNKYRGKRTASALEEYLLERGGRATKTECLTALKAGGCNLGERPEANLSTVISMNPRLFSLRGDRVMLVSSREKAA